MPHEKSETVQREDGRWINTYGRDTPQRGRPLPRLFQYEAESYASEAEASTAARRRSHDTDPKTERPRPGTPVLTDPVSPAPQGTGPDDERPDPGYEGKTGQARRAVEARGLKPDQDGYWAAVFHELRPDLDQPTPRPQLVPLGQYLRQRMGEASRGGVRPPGEAGGAGTMAHPAMLAQAEAREGMAGRLRRGIPSVEEGQMPVPNRELYREPELWPMPRVGPELLEPRELPPQEPPPWLRPPGMIPGTVQAPAQRSLATLTPEDLARLLQRSPGA